jgi:hypothetical protein
VSGIFFLVRAFALGFCAGEGESFFALIHCRPILPDVAEGGNRQILPPSGGGAPRQYHHFVVE